MSVADALFLRAQDITHTPQPGGSYDGPVWVETPAVPATIRASVYPVQGEKLKDLPEGVRTSAQYEVFVKSAVEEDDTLEINGDPLRVLMVEKWPSYRRLIVGGRSDGS